MNDSGEILCGLDRSNYERMEELASRYNATGVLEETSVTVTKWEKDVVIHGCVTEEGEGLFLLELVPPYRVVKFHCYGGSNELC